MNFEVHNLFAVPIYTTEMNNYVIQNKFEKLYNKYKSENKFKYNGTWNSHKLNDVEFKENLIEDNDLTEFRQEMLNHLGNYLKEIKFDGPGKCCIVSSWMTQSTNKDYFHAHTHGYHDISGVYYVKTNGDDGLFYFDNPLIGAGTNYACKGLLSRVYVQPKQGMLILFPSFIQHGVLTNTTDNDRVSVSFNIDLERH